MINTDLDREDERTWIYAFHLAQPLPVIDCSKTLRQVLFSRTRLKHNGRVCGIGKRGQLIAFAIGSLVSWGYPFYNRAIGQWFALASSILQVVALFSAYMVMRYDIILLLMRTYEFWYFTFMNITSNVCAGIEVGDLRISLVCVLIFLYEQSLLIDANYRGVKAAVVSSTVGALFVGLFLVFEGLDLIRDSTTVTLFTYGPWTLRSTDIVLNGISMVVVVLLRNAYRKYEIESAINHGRKGSVQCIAIRARVKLARTYPLINIEAATETTTRGTPTPRSQLRLVPSDLQVRAGDLLLPGAFSWQLQPWMQWLWMLLGITGLLLTSSLAWRRPSTTQRGLVAPCLALTVIYCLPCLACANRRLLRHILWSFDFLFLQTQLVVAYLILGFLVEWDRDHVAILLASWLWMQWLLSLDLLTPVIRRRLGLRLFVGVAIVAVHLVGHVWLCAELLVLRHWGLDDRELFHIRIYDRRVRFQAIPLLIGRLVAIFWWNWRLLVRLVRCHPDELVLIRAPVEYDDYIVVARHQSSRVIPVASPQPDVPPRRSRRGGMFAWLDGLINQRGA